MIKVWIRERDGTTPRLLTFETNEVLVGRLPENDLCIGGKGVSGQHCKLIRTHDAAYVEDLRSTNGTFVNRNRITARTRVGSSDVIEVAMYSLRIVDDDQAVERSTAARPPGPAPVAGPTFATGGPAQPPAIGSIVRPGQASAASGPHGPATHAASGQASGSSSRPPPSAGATSGPHGIDSADAQWAREWEKIDVLARAWMGDAKDGKRLLRGEKLRHAQRWLAASRGRAQKPKPEHRSFIHASARAARLRVTVYVLTGCGALGVISVLAVLLLQPPEHAPDPAEEEAKGEPAEVPEPREPEAPEVDPREASNALAAVARTELEDRHDPRIAALLAIEAMRLLPERRDRSTYGTAAETVLRETLTQLRDVPLLGHAAEITDVALSSDGRFAATTSTDGSARLWDLAAPGSVPSVVLRGHGDAVNALAISPDARRLYTAAADGTLLRWDLSQPDPSTTSIRMQGQETGVEAMALSRDGLWLVTGGVDGSVRLWSATTASPRPEKLGTHTGPVRAVDVSADGALAVSAGVDAIAFVWRVSGGQASGRTRLEGHENALEAIAISPDARFVLTGSTDGTARLWDPARRSGAKVLALHERPVVAVAFTPDSKLALTGGDDGKVLAWNLEAKEIELNATTFALHKGKIRALVATGPQPGTTGADAKRPRLSLSASDDGFARTWNLDRRDLETDSVALAGHGVPITAIAASTDGRLVITGAHDGKAHIWDPRATGAGGASRVARGHTAQVLDVALNRSATRMVTASHDGTARVWDLTRPGWPPVVGVLDGHTARVNAVAISPDERFIATAGEDRAVILWDLQTPGQGKLPLLGHTRGVTDLSFGPGVLVSISSADRTARVWKLTKTPSKDAFALKHPDEIGAMSLTPDGRWLMTGSISQVFLFDLTAADVAGSGRPLDRAKRPIHERDIVTVGVSPNGRWAVSSSVDPALVLWDLEDDDKPLRLRRHDDAVDVVAWSQDGRWLATGSRDTTIRLWDLSAAHPEESSVALAGHTQRISALRFSSDGRLLVSGSNDTTLRVWPLESPGKASLVLTGHEGVITGIDLDEDGTVVASASYDGSARVWPLQPEGLFEVACRRVGRSLTPEEWQQHFGTGKGRPPYRMTCQGTP